MQIFCPVTKEWWRLFVICKTRAKNAIEPTYEGLASAHTFFCSLFSKPKQELRVPDQTYDLSLKTSNDFICFWLVLLIKFLTYFSSFDHCPLLCAVYDTILSVIDEVLSIIPSANVFVLETPTSIIRAVWLLNLFS